MKKMVSNNLHNEKKKLKSGKKRKRQAMVEKTKPGDPQTCITLGLETKILRKRRRVWLKTRLFLDFFASFLRGQHRDETAL